LRISVWIGQLSCLMIFSTSLSVAAFLCRAGGSVLESTGSHGRGVEQRVPEMRRMVEFNCTSTRLMTVQYNAPSWRVLVPFCHTAQSALYWNEAFCPRQISTVYCVLTAKTELSQSCYTCCSSLKETNNIYLGVLDFISGLPAGNCNHWGHATVD